MVLIVWTFYNEYSGKYVQKKNMMVNSRLGLKFNTYVNFDPSGYFYALAEVSFLRWVAIRPVGPSTCDAY